jgi:hypothetical protein
MPLYVYALSRGSLRLDFSEVSGEGRIKTDILMTISGIISDDSHNRVCRRACTHTTYVLSSYTAPEAILLQAEGQRL